MNDVLWRRYTRLRRAEAAVLETMNKARQLQDIAEDRVTDFITLMEQLAVLVESNARLESERQSREEEVGR